MKTAMIRLSTIADVREFVGDIAAFDGDISEFVLPEIKDDILERI